MSCRSIELDCWDSEEGSSIVVVHGKIIPMYGKAFVSTALDFIDVVSVAVLHLYKFLGYLGIFFHL